MRAIVLAAVFVIILGIYAISQDQFFSEDFVEIEEIAVEGTTLAVANGCTAMIAETSEERAQAIQDGLAGVIEDRPTIYDAFTEVMDAYNMTLVSMAITRRDSANYYSDLIIQSPTQTLRLDIKPSDAIALALRTGAKMYINRTLLEEDGVEWCAPGE